MADPDPLQFPCQFPIKALGPSGEGFRELVTDIVRRHAPDLDEASISVRSSRAGSYLAVTLVICATSRHQLDAIYHDLDAHERVTMTL